MAQYGIVTGTKLASILPDILMKSSGGEIEFTSDSVFGTIDDLNNNLLIQAPKVIDSWKRIALVDYGFNNIDDIQASVEEFISVQDRMLSIGLNRVKLNLITENSDLYYEIQRGYQGFDGIIYPHTEVFLIQQKISQKIINKVLRGEYDGRGYFIPVKKPLSRIEQFDETRRQLSEDARTVSDEILEYEKDLPSSKLSGLDYADNEASIAKQEQEWLRQEGLLDQPTDSSSQDPYQDVQININTKRSTQTSRPSQSRPQQSNVDSHTGGMRQPTYVDDTGNQEQTYQPPSYDNRTRQIEKNEVLQSPYVRKGKVDASNIRGIEDLKYLYNQLANDANTVTDSKLLSDKGSRILVSGMANSGVSGFVAQTAEIYAMIGLKVLVIDLDVHKRMQTVYFSNFDRRISEGYGLSNGLLNVSNGGLVTQASVPVTSRISVCGISRTFSQVGDDAAQSIAYVLDEVTKDALNNGFDIVLIDCPLKYLHEYTNFLAGVDRMILLVDNKHYEMEHFLAVELTDLVESNTLLLRDLLKKTSIVLNKLVPNTRDVDGYRVDRQYVKNLLYKVGNPYDDIFVVGELPLYTRWEDQFITNKRYVWDDDLALGLIKNILREAV